MSLLLWGSLGFDAAGLSISNECNKHDFNIDVRAPVTTPGGPFAKLQMASVVSPGPSHRWHLLRPIGPLRPSGVLLLPRMTRHTTFVVSTARVRRQPHCSRAMGSRRNPLLRQTYLQVMLVCVSCVGSVFGGL